MNLPKDDGAALNAAISREPLDGRQALSGWAEPCGDVTPEAARAARADRRYRTIVADPPWRYEDDRWVNNRGAKKGTRSSMPYPTLPLAEIARLDVAALADPAGCHLYLWVTSRHLREGFAVLDGWGFPYVQALAWCKPPIGNGLGGVFAQTSEYVLFARRGKSDHSRREPSSWWVWPRGRHSAKPEAFYDLVESVSPGPYLDIFARRKRAGWDVWGDEVESDLELAV